MKYWGLDDKLDYTPLSRNEKASRSISAPLSHCGGLHEPKLWAISNLRPNTSRLMLVTGFLEPGSRSTIAQMGTPHLLCASRPILGLALIPSMNRVAFLPWGLISHALNQANGTLHSLECCTSGTVDTGHTLEWWTGGFGVLTEVIHTVINGGVRYDPGDDDDHHHHQQETTPHFSVPFKYNLREDPSWYGHSWYEY